MNAEDIIERGYFPREVPPCFHTRDFARYVAAEGSGPLTKLHGLQSTRAVRHNLARPGGLRRPLSVPNPLSFLHLAVAMDEAWSPLIDPLLATSRLSLRRPVPSLGPRAFAHQANPEESERKALARSGARILLKADVQNFYPSIYTHSIAWALHTKAVAQSKTNKSRLLGDYIDRAVRSGQSGQSMGIPIGCDTSWILGECIMSRIEEGLNARLKGVQGCRVTDDFELLFKSASEAENALGELQEVLAEYDLSVNPRKTRIGDLPESIEGGGVAELRSWIFRPSSTGQKTDLIAYFDALGEHIRRDRGGHIASYGVARLRTQPFLSTSWPLLEALLLQLLVSEPYSAKQVAMTLSMLSSAGHKVDPANLANAVERMILYHAPLGHGSEVAWSVWLAISHRSLISQEAADALSRMDDCFVALLTLHANQVSIIAGTLGTSLWEQAMNTDELDGSRWLLSYEARLKGWLPSMSTPNHISAHSLFGPLFSKGVSFYDIAALSLTHQVDQPITDDLASGATSPVPADTL